MSDMQQPDEGQLTPEQKETLRAAREKYEGRWLCKNPDCRLPVEANPTLFLNLSDDGSWSIHGVADECADVTCADGHSQEDPVLLKSMTAYLEEQFPCGTWQGSQMRDL